MQGYDFYVLNEKYNCKMQLGGDDQWSNMIAGMELVRKKSGKQVYGMTCTLLTNSEGNKMGKTAKGALWLDPEKTTPYEFYQYWRNVDDADVDKCLRLLTFVPMDEVRKLCALEGAEINKAKEVLAFEVTKAIHGEEEAIKAQNAARALFEGANAGGSIPFTEFEKSNFENGVGVLDLLKEVGLTKSNSEGRRLVQQGGITIDDKKVDDVNKTVTLDDFEDGKILIRKGKKVYHQIRIK